MYAISISTVVTRVPQVSGLEAQASEWEVQGSEQEVQVLEWEAQGLEAQASHQAAQASHRDHLWDLDLNRVYVICKGSLALAFYCCLLL